MSELETLTEEHFPIQKRWILKMTMIQFLLTALSFFVGFLALTVINHLRGKEPSHLLSAIAGIICGATAASFCWYLLYRSSLKHFHFQITNDGLFLKHGIVFEKEKSISHSEISNVFLCQGHLDKWWDLASVVLSTASRKSKSSNPKAWNREPGPVSNMIGFPGLEYNNALLLKDTLEKLIQMNRSNGSQSSS